jgi:hypothetical protein
MVAVAESVDNDMIDFSSRMNRRSASPDLVELEDRGTG